MALQQPGDYWIGLSDADQDGTFVWANSGREATFTAWAGNQPNGGVAENCVALREANSFFWSDEDCTLLRNPVCYR